VKVLPKELGSLKMKGLVLFALLNIVPKCMLGCFFRFGVGILKRIQGKLNSEAYQNKVVNDINIVGNCMVFPLRRFIFQHDIYCLFQNQSGHYLL